MDFLKSCWTNLHAVEGYSHIDYLIYNHKDTTTNANKGQWDDPEQRHELLVGLRQRRVLVQSAVQQKKVCVFGGFHAADEYMKEQNWQVHQRGRLETAALTRANSDSKMVMQNQHIFTMFLGAVEASLSMSLSLRCGAVRVGHLSWMVPTDGDYQLLSLRTQMTSQGTLALLPHASNTGLSTASDTDGTSVILAPSGTPATVSSSLDSLALDDHAPPHRARREARLRLSRRAREDSWKSCATPKLRQSSLPCSDDSWLRVNLVQDNVECLWPAPLCLENPSRTPAPSLETVDSMHWFGAKDAYQDPLDAAESWFLGQEERAQLEQTNRQAEKDKEDAANNPPEDPVPDHLSVTSPVYARSLQDHMSVNGIYPTPPDALPPVVCADSSIPSVVISDNPVQVMPSLSVEIQDHDQDPDQDPDHTMRRNSDTSNPDLQHHHLRKGSSDDLFGDRDDDMFGNPDLTDADFSYFDDPGAVRAMPAIPGTSEEATNVDVEPEPEPEPSLQHPIALNPEPEDPAPQKPLHLGENEQAKGLKVEDSMRTTVSTPPLSPLKIKERLLPPEESDKGIDRVRRDSTFLPIVFKGDINNSDAKYRALGKFDSKFTKTTDNSVRSNSIALPEKPLRPRASNRFLRRHVTIADTKHIPIIDDMSDHDTDLDTSQGSDSESISSVEGSLRSLDIRKRKRISADEGTSPRFLAESVVESDVESVISEATAMADPSQTLEQLLAPRESQNRIVEQQCKFSDNSTIWRTPSKSLSSSQNFNIWAVLDFTANDLVDIAQTTAEQSTFSGFATSETTDNPTVDSPVYLTAQDALKQVFEKAQDCDFAKVGAMAASHAGQAIAAAAKSQQRPIPRRPGPVNSVITIPAPAVHVHRAGQEWELQPTAIKFWDTLGLEPAHGPKDVVAFALYPDSGMMSEAVADFLQDARLAYESRKLGRHFIGGETSEHEDGLMPYRSHGEASTVNVLQGIQTSCNTLGELLHEAELDDPIIIYMINPFQDQAMVKYMCACFQAMYTAYSSDREDSPPLILQIIPMDRIACPSALIVPDQAWLSSLVSFVYDRIPSTEDTEHTFAWHFAASPCVQIATPPSRKINFVLAQKIPRNLLDEAQILHLAYAVNADNSWLSAAWTDNSGRHQHKVSYCLSSADGRVVLNEVRDTTLSLARNSNSRIFVVRAGVMRDWEKRVWREHSAENWSIALLDLDVSPALQVGANNNDSTAQAAFLTPAATPQASTFTSPETGGQPSTPAGETPQQDIQQLPDPDAFLVDNTDETWGVIMPFSCTRSSSLSRPLASGLLLKRGSPDSLCNLPSLGVDLMDVMPPRTPDGVQSWLTQRAPETVLKECLVWYRGLSLLAKIRGVPGAEKGHVPWHVAVTMCGADALQGFLE